MDNDLVKILKSGGLAVLPTDTIYGLHTLASSQSSVEKIYSLKGRKSHKPLIILISSLDKLSDFGVKLSKNDKKLLKKLWPNPVSVVLSVVQPKWNYLHRGTNSLAFRIPKNVFLLEILKQTGPLVSTSANPEGKKSSENIKQAKKYFANLVDFYFDAGELKSPPSTVLKLSDGKLEILRSGSFDVKNLLS